MKIALVLSSPPGYSETFFNSQIKGLKENGHEVTLFTGNDTDNYRYCTHMRHPKIYKSVVMQIFAMLYVGLRLLPYFKIVNSYCHLEKKEGTPFKRIIEKVYLNASLLKYRGDWVHYGFATMVLGRELVPKAINAKMAVSFRGYDINVYPLKHKNCYSLLWRQVDKIHSISRFLLNRAYELGLDKNKIFQIIHPAIDFENLPKPIENTKEDKFKIVTIARFSWIKGLDLLTQVASVLKNKNLNFEWILIGAGSDAEKERYLYDVHEKKLGQQLANIGKTSHQDTLKILQKCDVYVQTSLNEGFCNSILEAQAIGIPCVAFNVGGLPENIADKKTGWLIDSFDTVTMAEKIYEISHLSRAQKESISWHAMKRVHENFKIDKQKKAFNEFYGI